MQSYEKFEYFLNFVLAVACEVIIVLKNSTLVLKMIMNCFSNQVRQLWMAIEYFPKVFHLTTGIFKLEHISWHLKSSLCFASFFLYQMLCTCFLCRNSCLNEVLNSLVLLISFYRLTISKSIQKLSLRILIIRWIPFYIDPVLKRSFQYEISWSNKLKFNCWQTHCFLTSKKRVRMNKNQSGNDRGLSSYILRYFKGEWYDAWF